MTECREIRIRPRQGEKGATIDATIGLFARSAHGNVVPGIVPQFMSAKPLESCGAGSRAKLKRYTGSTAHKAVELPTTAPNPERVSRWLETGAPHISLAFSPLKERGPPRP